MEEVLSELIPLEVLADSCWVGIKRSAMAPRDRSAWHVTNLLASADLIAKGDVRYHAPVDAPSGIMSLGRVWEAAVDCYLSAFFNGIGGAYIPDVVTSSDGVVASLDGVAVLPDGGLAVVETKLRFSPDGAIPFPHIQQVRAYCHAIGTQLVYYVSGHVSSRPPDFSARLRLLHMKEHEVADTWAVIAATKRYLEELGILPGQ